MTTEVGKTLYRMNFSGYVSHIVECSLLRAV